MVVKLSHLGMIKCDKTHNYLPTCILRMYPHGGLLSKSEANFILDRATTLIG